MKKDTFWMLLAGGALLWAIIEANKKPPINPGEATETTTDTAVSGARRKWSNATGYGKK